jgi:hypothetical protein
MPRRKLPYKEGDWFAVPMDNATWALGMAARVSRGGGVLGYFFGPRRLEVPAAGETRGLNANNPIDICKFGDIGPINGEWPVIHQTDDWRRDQWPMPAFGRVDLVDPRIGYRSIYRDDSIEGLVTETRVTAEEARSLPYDCSYGYLALIDHLQRLLA